MLTVVGMLDRGVSGGRRHYAGLLVLVPRCPLVVLLRIDLFDQLDKTFPGRI